MARRHKKLIPIIAGLVIVLLSVAWQYASAPIVQDIRQRLESVIFDIRMNTNLYFQQEKEVDERVIIVTVDEKSLKHQGHWPWPRDRIATLINQLFEGGAVVIGFDIMFPEKQLNSVEHILATVPDQTPLYDSLQSLRPQFDLDNALAKSFESGDVVLGYSFHSDKTKSPYPLPDPTIINGSDNLAPIYEMPAYSTNIPELQQTAIGAGFVTTVPDDDGILRRTPMVISHEGKLYASLSLEMVRLYYLHESAQLNTTRISDQDVAESIELGKLRIPVDASGKAIIPYRGESPKFHYISATDVLENKIDLTIFENKLVIVGATALGLYDYIATPVQSIYPGVEVHASMLSAILDESFPNNPHWAQGANFLLILGVGLFLVFLLPRLDPFALILLVSTLTAGVIYINFWWWQQGWVLDLAALLIMIALLSVLNLSHGYIIENRQRHFLKSSFGQYIPPALVDQMLHTEESISMEGESREMSVLFADIRSFTTISESMPPAELKEMLNHFFTHMTGTIFDHQGTIDKYVGDMIMAFWGAPLEDKHHAQHAVTAALTMLEITENLKPEFKERGFPEVNIGIGINTGVMNVGDMGSNYRRAYTVLGDSVNLASRIEGLTKFYGAGLVIGEDTFNQTDGYLCRKLDRVKVKGKLKAVEVYEPICLSEQADKKLLQEVDLFHQGLEHYWQQQWHNANSIFSELLRCTPSSVLYKLYLERINTVSKLSLPDDWDGVYERRSK